MDQADAYHVRIVMIEFLEDTLADARLVAIEAMFELDPFDWEAQKDFEEALNNL